MTVVSPTHTYAAVGDFPVTLTVTDSHGATNSASASAHITQANTVPVANAGGPYAGTVGQNVAFSGSLSSDADHDPLTYAWNFGDGATAAASAAATAVHSYSAKGTFTVTLTVNDGRGGIASAGTNAVIAPANSPPVANAGGPYSGTTGQPVSFSATASDPDNDPLSFTWDFGDGSTPPGTGATPSHTYALANDYTVRLSVSDGHGGSTTVVSAAHIVLANRAPTANPGGPYSGTAGQAVSFNGAASSDPDNDPLTFNWDFGDGTPPVANATATPTHAFTASGDYTARLTVTDGRGGTSTNGASVHVVAQNVAPVVSAGPARSITYPAAATLAGSATDDGLPAASTLTTLWTKVSGPGVVSFTNAATPATGASFDQAGTYVLRLSASDSQLSTSADVTITVGQADATIQVNGYNGLYDARPHTATGSATGVNGEDFSALLHLGGSFTDAPGGTASWTFDGNPNYKAVAGSAAIVIGQASATIQVAGFNGVFDGSAHGATGSAIGVNGETLSTLLHLGASFTDAPGGVAQWTFDGNADYKPAAGSVPITISAVAQPDATVQVTGFTGVYDGNAHGATGTATGTNGENLTSLLHLGASFTDVPGGSAHWTFDGNATYRAKSGDAPIAITAADATIHVTGFAGVDDGQPHGATGSATGVKGENLFGLLTLGSSFSAAPGGTAHWTFAGNSDYKAASGDVTIALAPASNRLPPVITLSAPKEALPGAKLTITADVSGNVTSVQLQIDQADPVTVTGPPYQRLVTIADVATPGTSIAVRGTAVDGAGGIGTASAQIKIVAEPDTTKPTVSLKAPPQAAPGSAIVITAIAADNVGVDAVGFSVNGTAFASVANLPYQVTYVVPPDTPAQSVPDLLGARGRRRR